MRWLHIEHNGMWYMAVDDTGEVWGCSAESAVHACNEARGRRANGQCSISAEWAGAYVTTPLGYVTAIEVEVTFKA